MVVYPDDSLSANPLGLTGPSTPPFPYPPYVYSNDEDSEDTGGGSFTNNAISMATWADPFPTYQPPGSEMPVAYFNSRGYDRAWGTADTPVWGPVAAKINMYLPNGAIDEVGVAKPYASAVVDTTPPTTLHGTALASPALEFSNNGTFQLIAAGLDNNFGGLIGTASDVGATAAPVNVYPSGLYYNPFSSTVKETPRYQDDEYIGNSLYTFQPQLDNVTNFCTRTLESDLP